MPVVIQVFVLRRTLDVSASFGFTRYCSGCYREVVVAWRVVAAYSSSYRPGLSVSVPPALYHELTRDAHAVEPVSLRLLGLLRRVRPQQGGSDDRQDKTQHTTSTPPRVRRRVRCSLVVRWPKRVGGTQGLLSCCCDHATR